jgi:hypothetical protein
MADRWLNGLNAMENNIIFNNRNRRKAYNFDIEKYDDQQFRSRYRLAKEDVQGLPLAGHYQTRYNYSCMHITVVEDLLPLIYNC